MREHIAAIGGPKATTETLSPPTDATEGSPAHLSPRDDPHTNTLDERVEEEHIEETSPLPPGEKDDQDPPLDPSVNTESDQPAAGAFSQQQISSLHDETQSNVTEGTESSDTSTPPAVPATQPATIDTPPSLETLQEPIPSPEPSAHRESKPNPPVTADEWTQAVSIGGEALKSHYENLVRFQTTARSAPPRSHNRNK